MTTTHSIESISLAGKRTIGPYSDAVRIGDLLFLSGRIGLDYDNMTLVEGGIAAQTRRCLANIEEVLLLVGSSLEQVVKTTVFLNSMTDFAAMNEVYAATFGERKPTRSTVAVAAYRWARWSRLKWLLARRLPDWDSHRDGHGVPLGIEFWE